MARLPRESIQMTARINGDPSAPTATVPDHWAVHPTPIRSLGGHAASARARREAAPMADHHSSGSCSAPPPSSRWRATGSVAWATIRPGGRHHRHLGAPGAQVDGQDVLLGPVRPVLLAHGAATHRRRLTP